MCGRYFIDDEMWREIRKICKQIDDAKLKVTVGDVRPTDMAMVLTGMKNVHLEAMRWGFTSKYKTGCLLMPGPRVFYRSLHFGTACGIAGV